MSIAIPMAPPTLGVSLFSLPCENSVGPLAAQVGNE
jgi:hypothetical protein